MIRTALPAALLCLLGLLQACGTSAETTMAPITNESSAAQIAETAFVNATKHQITKYSIHPSKHTATEWLFVVEGTAEFARPGYHWLIAVDKATGQSRVVSGE